ncbi:MAG: hypothetical protein Q8903_11220 [Bacteroidota bacterium]|nr:hypothetical protein [Bacteroidota bacterium]
MKKLFILLIFLTVMSVSLFAQSIPANVIYLKNGSIIKGDIIELTDSVKIQTSDGSIFIYSMQDVKKIAKGETKKEPTIELKKDTTAVIKKELTAETKKDSTAETKKETTIETKREPTALTPNEPTVSSKSNPKASSRPNISEEDQTAEQDQEQLPAVQKDGFGLRGGFFANLASWSDLVGNIDSRLGVGLMGVLTAGYDFNNMYVGLGPGFDVNYWWQTKTVGKNSATMSITTSGLTFNLAFGIDDMFVLVGTGSSAVSVGASVNGSSIGNESDSIDLPNKASFTRYMFGWGSTVGIAFSWVSYSGWGKHLSRFEINIGLSF